MAGNELYLWLGPFFLAVGPKPFTFYTGNHRDSLSFSQLLYLCRPLFFCNRQKYLSHIYHFHPGNFLQKRERRYV